MSSGIMGSCSYTSQMSMMVMKGWAATASRIISWLGSGIESRMVLVFRSRASIMVRSFSSFPALGWIIAAQHFGRELVPTSPLLCSVPFFLGAAGIEHLSNVVSASSIVLPGL